MCLGCIECMACSLCFINMCGVCSSVRQSVCHVALLGFTVGSFGTAFAKSFWPLVMSIIGCVIVMLFMLCAGSRL